MPKAFKYSQIARPALIEPLLDHLGVEDKDTRMACSLYAQQTLTELGPEVVVGDLLDLLCAFFDGYEAAIKRFCPT